MKASIWRARKRNVQGGKVRSREARSRRARIFRKWLTRLEKHTPKWLVRLQLQLLLNLTARAFRARGQRIWQLPPEKALRAYALYTVGCMQSRRAEPERLYRQAFRLGQRLRRLTGFTESRDLQRLVFFLYKNIRICMKGRLPGEITIPACYFSRFYSPEQCACMSSVDAGVIAGLYGGGELLFTERLTQGCPACTAHFARETL